MDFKEQIKQLGQKVLSLKDQIHTEEATKSAFIMPFIQILGYDLFNPMEVIPEFTTDFGAKNIEKVDYAIKKDGKPVIIIECKHHLENLEKHYTQTHKYFHLSEVKFAVLTNGINYHFYTDMDLMNKMDSKPFFSFDITNIKEQQIKELAKFHKTGFDVKAIGETASELKFSNEIKNVLINELSNPSQEFVKYFVTHVYEGKATEKVMALFTEYVKRTIDQTFNDLVSDRLMNAINQTKQASIEAQAENPVNLDVVEEAIITTEEEINGFYIVKSIVRNKVMVNRISFRNSHSYFSINLDDNNRKPICRLWFNGQHKKYIGLFDKEKKEIKHEIFSLDNIYDFTDHILLTPSFYEKETLSKIESVG